MQTVSCEDVEQCLRLLWNDCSTGYDNIPAMIIKPVVEFLVSPTTFVINNYIATNNFPDAWKTARISPTPKITQPVELKDYRAVLILPVLSNVNEKLVLQQLAVFIERESVYHQARRNHPTATLLLKLHDDIKKAMKSSKVTIALLTDYWKAFDTIDCSIWIKKMHTLNFSERFLYWNFQKANAFNTLTIPQSTRVVKQKKVTKCSSETYRTMKLLEQWSKSTNLVCNCKKAKWMLFSTRKMTQHH